MFISAGNGEEFSFSKSMGVGLVEISINLSRYLSSLERLPEKLIFIGSAGSYRKDLEIFQILESWNGANIELSFLQKQSYTPIQNLVSSGKGGVVVNSSNYITTDMKLGEKFSKMGISLENMEFFGFLSVAQKFGIPAGGVFIITNYTDSNAHGDFLKNREEAMRRLEKYFK
jgi:purine-nucleoside phosphorylase